MRGEVYAHVPDLEWPRWGEISRTLYVKLDRPMTIAKVLVWSRTAEISVGGKMGKSRRESYVRNMLAWLSIVGLVDCVDGKWRRLAVEREELKKAI